MIKMIYNQIKIVKILTIYNNLIKMIILQIIINNKLKDKVRDILKIKFKILKEYPIIFHKLKKLLKFKTFKRKKFRNFDQVIIHMMM